MSDLLDKFSAHPLFSNFISLLIGLLLVLILVRFTQRIASLNIRDNDLRYKTRKAISLTGYGLGLIVAISIFSNQLSNLPVLIGLLGVGIGFALRELIQSLFGSLVITFGNLYKPGERIQIGNVMGDVMDIGPLTTTVMECGDWVKSDLYNGRVVYLPNNLVLREQVLNYSVDFPYLWDELVVPVAHGSDHRLAREILLEAGYRLQGETLTAARESWRNFQLHHRPEDTPLDIVVTLNFDANWIELTLRYLTDYRTRRASKDRLFSEILDAIGQTAGQVKIATPVLHLTELPPLSLKRSA